jgi:hypothetical protein
MESQNFLEKIVSTNQELEFFTLLSDWLIFSEQKQMIIN